jgi:D-glycero-D-manno-heptose 1,7-bisphosphate phosphatase
MSLKDLNIDKFWTLFLDRDGVINRRIPDDYVKTWEQFEFIEGVVEAIVRFSEIFGRIIVVSNQQGIGKGIMTVSELDVIHEKMKNEIEISNGKIHKVYYCPDLAGTSSFFRKPNVGMGLRAKKDFPEINFHHSVMAGDSKSDMEFGKRLGMKKVFISTNLIEIRKHARITDFAFSSLRQFSEQI